jgi:serine/threonine protein kinase
MLQKLYPCPHIIEIIGVVTSATDFSLVMSLAKDSLFGVISQCFNKNPISWSLKQKLLRDISAGIGFIHAAGVVHGDLKPSNILIDSNYNAKIADFGGKRSLSLIRLRISQQRFFEV